MATPDAATLITAVRQFLERDLLPGLDGQKAFHTRVAANVLGIVLRELAAPAASAPNAETLCAEIRTGTVTDRTPELLDTLLAEAIRQLAIDNPKYSTYLRMVGAPGTAGPHAGPAPGPSTRA